MDESEFSAESQQLPRVADELRDLAQGEFGIAFIYAALGLIAKRFQLRDVAIVLVSSSSGTQIFRLDGRAVNPESRGQLGLSPGVYCVPDVVPVEDAEALYAACHTAYSSRHVQGSSRQSIRPMVTSTHGGPSWVVRPTSDEDTTTTLARHTRGRRRRVLSSGKMRSRMYVSRVLFLLDVAAFAVTDAGVHGPARILLGLILGVVIPGWCVVASLKLDNTALELGLTMAVSLSILMLLAQILITVKLWHLVALEEVTAIACSPLLLYQAIRPGRRGN
jgi:hypothetical protein